MDAIGPQECPGVREGHPDANTGRQASLAAAGDQLPLRDSFDKKDRWGTGRVDLAL
jgi:hypothetical protein